jgi:putative endopeptidase
MKVNRIAALVTIFALSICVGAVGGLVIREVRSFEVDASVKPGDDFYHYANGTWLKSVSDRKSYDTRAILTERTNQRVRELIQDAASGQGAKGSIPQQVGDYYTSMMDENAIEAKGLTPLQPEMRAIAAIKDKKELSSYLGSTLNTETDGLTSNNDHVFGLWVNQSFADSKHYFFHLWQGGLGLPDRETYLEDSAQATDLRSKYKSHIAAILRLADVSGAETRAEKILALEIRIAKSHAPDSDAADVFKQNNPWKRGDFATKAPGMDWQAYLQAAGVEKENLFIVWQPSAVTGTSALVASESLDTWKDYLAYHLVEHYASVLPKAFAAEEFAFYGATLSGAQQPRAREAIAISATNAAVGQAVGQLYTQKYFPPEAKAKAQDMVNDLVAAYRTRIANLSWMSPATKKKALAKLATLIVGVGYPDKWIDYSSLEVVRGDAVGNMRRAETFNRSLNLAKLKQPADPGEWRIDAQIVGAVIVFSPNTETFSAGILQPPYFDPDGDTASNYGSAGAGMAHEIAHSFDELGNIYDDQGRLSKWWTKADADKYHAAVAKFAAQLGKYCPFADGCVNGKQVVNESVADLAGLNVAHDAYILSLKGKQDVTIDGLNGEQRFFLAFAQRWRKLQSDAALRNQLKSDIHLPAEYRGDAVRHADAWYRAYDVSANDKLYLKPEDRTRIW